jgi:hypothetical protein
MIEKHKVIFENGDKIIHAGRADGMDTTLCGDDIVGDSIDERGSYYCVSTKEKINCERCIEIIKFCKSIKRSEYV